MDSTQPITGPEYDRLLLELIKDHGAIPDPYSPDKFVDFILCTGIHPHALAHPEFHHLRVTEDGITWRRPKTHATVVVPIHDRLKPWVAEFVKDLPESNRLFYNRLVKRWGRQHAMPDLTPRALRHTFAYRIWEGTGHDLNAAKALAGTTERVLLNYARVKKQSWEGKLPSAW